MTSVTDGVAVGDGNKTTKSTARDEEEKDTIILPSNRFELELEFLQSLASPAYLHHLATTGVLNDASFIKFLEYLQTYWSTPAYVKFVQYPHAFFMLDLLINNSQFRRELANLPFRNFIHEQQFYAWQHRARTLYGSGPPSSIQQQPQSSSSNDDDGHDDDATTKEQP